ncbi:MAG TPA: type II secretion system protein, partial [Planctomycetota bacterium]|nr:type II secretion system protein [Planctomycetota bacterium]
MRGLFMSTPGGRLRGNKFSRGFTLLEVVITVALLASVTLSGMLLIVPVARQARIRREVQIANTAARRMLEKVQAAPFSEILTLYPTSYVESITDLPGGTLSITYVDPAADPLEIQASLTWESAEMGTMQRT